jgi:hypothetical protein
MAFLPATGGRDLEQPSRILRQALEQNPIHYGGTTVQVTVASYVGGTVAKPEVRPHLRATLSRRGWPRVHPAARERRIRRRGRPEVPFPDRSRSPIATCARCRGFGALHGFRTRGRSIEQAAPAPGGSVLWPRPRHDARHPVWTFGPSSGPLWRRRAVKVFKADNRCPHCGGDASFKLRRPGLGTASAPDAYMHRRCEDCGFSWSEAPPSAPMASSGESPR